MVRKTEVQQWKVREEINNGSSINLCLREPELIKVRSHVLLLLTLLVLFVQANGNASVRVKN